MDTDLFSSISPQWEKYLIAIAIFIGGTLLVLALRKLFHRKRKKQEDTNDFAAIWPKVIDKVFVPFAIYGAFYLGFTTLELNDTINRIVVTVGYILLGLVGVNLIVNILERILIHRWLKGEHDELRVRSYRGVISLIKFLIWGAAVIFILDNLGFKVTTVITGLGIGGVAIALGAQAILGDLFSYFAILFDRPFRINDFLIINEHLGTVEKIGIKTTRLRSLSGEELVFSNSDITGSRIKNYGKMEERRINFHFGVIYQTPAEKLEKIPGIVQAICEPLENVRFDRCHFHAFADYSLIFENIYYVTKPDYFMYMEIQQKINLELKKALEQEGIEFAFPTNRVFLHKIE